VINSVLYEDGLPKQMNIEHMQERCIVTKLFWYSTNSFSEINKYNFA